MSLDMSFFFSVGILFISMFYVVHMIYGRINKRSIFGNYKAGKPGYDEFRKMVDNNLHLSIACVVAATSFVFSVVYASLIVDVTSSYFTVTTVPLLIGIIFWITVKVVAKRLIDNK